MLRYHNSLPNVIKAVYPEYAQIRSEGSEESPVQGVSKRNARGYWKDAEHLMQILAKAEQVLNISEVFHLSSVAPPPTQRLRFTSISQEIGIL